MNDMPVDAVPVPPATAVAEYTPTAAGLAELRGRLANVVYDLSTGAGMDKAKVDRRECVKLRTSLEALRADLKAPVVERGRLIDAEAKRITAEILELEDPIDQQIKAEENRKAVEKAAREQAERERIVTINKRIDWIRGAVIEAIGKPLAEVEELAASIAALPITEELYGEFMPSAIAAQAAATDKLAELIVEGRALAVREAALAASQADLAAQLAQVAADRKRLKDEEAARRAAEQAAEEAAAAIAAAEQRARDEAEAAAAAVRRQEKEEADRKAAQEAQEAAQAKEAADYQAALAAARYDTLAGAMAAIATVALDGTVSDRDARARIQLICAANDAVSSPLVVA